MKSILFIAVLFVASIGSMATPASASDFPGRINDLLVCDRPVIGGDASHCIEATHRNTNPQGREIWLYSEVEVAPGAVRSDMPYAIAISAMASSNVFWNGELVASNGTPGSNAESEVPGKMDAVLYLPSHLFREGTNQLQIHMSSFHNPVHVTAPVHDIGIYRYHSPTRLRLRGYIPALITAGGLFLAALYFGMAFAFDRKQYGALFLALMSLSTIGQLSAESLRGLWAYDYPVHVVRLSLVVGFAFAFSLSLVGFVSWRFNRKWMKGALIAVALLGLVTMPTFSAYDMRTSIILLTGSLVAGATLVPIIKLPQLAPRLILGALAAFAILIFVRADQFLDQDFYYAVLVLSAALFVGEVTSRRQDAQARREADTRAARLELELLRRQISPHFLMNTLNVLSAWVEQDPKVSVNIIETLASECRALDDLSRKQLIPLAEELALCETHLKLMSYRTEVAFSLETKGDIIGRIIPPAAILTLIENAFSHNHYPKGAAFKLSIKSVGGATQLEFCAPLGEKRQSSRSYEGHEGMGMPYLRARLNDAFGSKWTLDQGADEENHWRVEMSYSPAP